VVIKASAVLRKEALTRGIKDGQKRQAQLAAVGVTRKDKHGAVFFDFFEELGLVG
jgi:hypothetical protein